MLEYLKKNAWIPSCCSSVSVWVKNCEELDLPEEEKDTLDEFIDQLYEDMDKGTISSSQPMI